MKRLFIVLTVIMVIGNAVAYADDCYGERLSKGDNALKAKKYDMAIDYYENAKKCTNCKSKTELNQRIAKAKKLKREEEERAKALSVSRNDITFSEKGGSVVSVTVNSRKAWSYSGVPYWLNISKDGNVLNISCANNAEKYERNCNVTVSNGSNTQTIHISQDAKKQSYINISPNYIKFDYKGNNTKTATITTDASSVSRTDLKHSPSNYWYETNIYYGNQIYVACEKNNSHNPRRDVANFKTNDGSTATLTIEQDGKPKLIALRSVGVRGGGSIEAFVQFNTSNDNIVDLGFGRWNLCGGWGLTGIYNWQLPIGDSWRSNWSAYFGAGLALGGASGYGFIGAVAGNAEIEYAWNDWGFGLNYMPKLGFGSGCGFYGDGVNFNLILRYYFNK